MTGVLPERDLELQEASYGVMEAGVGVMRDEQPPEAAE